MADVMMFVFPLGLVRVCEIEISQMGKNNGNPDQLCEKNLHVLVRLCG